MLLLLALPASAAALLAVLVARLAPKAAAAAAAWQDHHFPEGVSVVLGGAKLPQSLPPSVSQPSSSGCNGGQRYQATSSIDSADTVFSLDLQQPHSASSVQTVCPLLFLADKQPSMSQF
jgi:hypothetical protein